MELTPDQQKIVDLVNQLPDNVKQEMLSQMHISTDTTKKDLKDVMLSSDAHNKEKDMIEKYTATQKIVEEFHQLCLSFSEKNKPDVFDSMALSVQAISQLATPLLHIWGKEDLHDKTMDTIINGLKAHFIKSYTTRYFFHDVSTWKTLDQFKDTLQKEIPQRIEKFNTSVVDCTTNLDIDTIDIGQAHTITDFNKHLVNAFEKIDKFEKNKEFTDKMWDTFVKDFVEKAEKIGYPRGAKNYRWDGNDIELEEYKAWFFEHIFNIAYHTADYIDHIKNDRNPIYCFNYQLLHNNFDIEKSDHYDFQVNHIEKSTTYSNLVYTWAEELGIKKLKVLVGKYLIKP